MNVVCTKKYFPEVHMAESELGIKLKEMYEIGAAKKEAAT